MGFERHFSDSAKRMQPVAIREILKRGSKPGMIAFVAGQPVPALFPAAGIGIQAQQVLETLGPNSLQYSATEGYQPLREWIADRTPHATADNVLIVSGSQQALDLTCKLFVNPGNKIVVAEPSYSGALNTFSVYGANYLAVKCDDQGMLPDSLEAALQQDASLIYCVPNYMNPTGINMSLARRQNLIELAERYDVPIIEDDPYGELRFEGEKIPNLHTLNPNIVIYASTFSKTLAPGLRMAWLIAPDAVYEKFVAAKQTADLQSASYTQRIVHELLEDDFMERQIAQLVTYYKGQRDAMIAALDRHFPPEVSFTRPTGGMFVWCECPPEINTTDLLETAMAQNVAYMPGSPFHPHGDGENTFRLSFTLATHEEIERGIATLGSILRQAIAKLA